MLLPRKLKLILFIFFYALHWRWIEHQPSEIIFYRILCPCCPAVHPGHRSRVYLATQNHYRLIYSLLTATGLLVNIISFPHGSHQYLANCVMQIICAWLNKSWNILIDEGSCVTKVDFKCGYFSKRSLFMQNGVLLQGCCIKSKNSICAI